MSQQALRADAWYTSAGGTTYFARTEPLTVDARDRWQSSGGAQRLPPTCADRRNLGFRQQPALQRAGAVRYPVTSLGLSSPG
jgi:hypothetical protein